MWRCLVFALVVSAALGMEDREKGQDPPQNPPSQGVPPLVCPVPFDDKAPWQYWYADPENCNSYYVCDREQRAVRMLCPAGLWWDDLSKTCMYVENFPPKHQADCMQKLRGVGTTGQLREVFIGRCWEYQLFKNPSLFRSGYKDCEGMFEQLAGVFVGKAPCGVIQRSDYLPLVQAANTHIAPNKHLLWSGVYSMAQEYARLGEVAYTLESSLIGYIMNDVTWCGQTNGEGINFDWCPAFASCANHVMASFWAAATEQFASQASGVVTIMLNGSRTDGPAFRNNSFLAEHDIPKLDPRSVVLVKAWVIHDLEGPYVETCDSASLRILENRIRYKGIKFECQDNPAPVVHLLCAKQPYYPYCALVREQAGLSILDTDPREPIRLDEAHNPDPHAAQPQGYLTVKGTPHGYPENQVVQNSVEQPIEEGYSYSGPEQVEQHERPGSYGEGPENPPDPPAGYSYQPPEPQQQPPNSYAPVAPQPQPQYPPPPPPAPQQPSYPPQQSSYSPQPKPAAYDQRLYGPQKPKLNEIVHHAQQ